MPEVLPGLARLVTEAKFSDFSPAVVDRTKLILFHNLVVALAARTMDVPGADRTGWPEKMPTADTARRLSDMRPSPLLEAVVTNSLLMGARAQHDELPAATSHFGSTVIPPLLALSDANGLSGRAFLVAMVAGYEVGARLGRAAMPASRKRGFRPTGIFGPIASAAACAKALGLTTEQTVSALALAANTGAGLMEVWLQGTDEWRYQTAAAARNGLWSARLAESGVRGAATSMEGKAGFLHAYTGDSTLILDTQPSPARPAIMDVLLKAYPVCALHQAAMQQLLGLCRSGELRPADIETIVISIESDDAAYPGVDVVSGPQSPAAALMNLRYCAAMAVLHGRLDLPAGWNLEAPAPMAMMKRISIRAFAPEETVLRGAHSAGVRIVLRDGRKMADGPAPLTYHRVSAAELSRELLPDAGFTRDAIDRLESTVFALEDLECASTLVDALG